MKTHSFLVDGSSDGMRIDLFLAACLPELSRRKVRAILDVGGVYVNRHRMRVASRTVKKGDQVKVEYNLDSLKKIKSTNFEFSDEEILCINEDFIAVNKPPGLPSQATRDQAVLHAEAAIKKYLQKKSGKPARITLLHRLDKETSGILLFGRTQAASETIANYFRERTIKKTYLALVAGVPKSSTFEISNYLSDIDKRTGSVKSVHAGGKLAKTRFEVLQSHAKLNVSLVQCYPETGRSHQIRVHLAEHGNAIIGDKRYSSKARAQLSDSLKILTTDHHLLHAAKLTFTFKNQVFDLQAPLPKNFAKILCAIWAELDSDS